MKKWTPAQESAINSLGGTVLVSAAAGSGKTTVLVERIINRITNPVSPSSVDRLLVVTFTKAAAAEMKTRLSDAISRLIEKDPSNTFLKRQKLYLPEAQICTMDSFCGRLVKENFDALSISPDYTLLTDTENKIILSEAAEEILSELYECENEDEARLLELFTNQKNDNTLKELFIKMYNLAMANSDPDLWLEGAFAPYFENTDLEKSECGRYVLSALSEHAKFVLEKIEKVFLDSMGSGKLWQAVNDDLTAAESAIRDVIEKIENHSPWDDVREAVNAVSIGNFTRFKEDEKDALYYEIKARRDFIKKDAENLKGFLTCTAEDYYDDVNYLRPIMESLKNAVKRFIDKVFEVKTERNAYYFTDILHFALDLLYEKSADGTYTKSALALELSNDFDEILIDEFQDTNEAQVSLFNAVSKNGNNQFVVGDVKQSIYAFREACPEIFVSLLNAVPCYDGTSYPAKIYLDSNFRSRKGVVDAVNFFFDFLMLPSLGGLDYKKTERLCFSAVGFEEREAPDAEVHIVESPDGRGSNFIKESRYIGSLINKMISEKMPVGRGESVHPVQYKDICILMRAVKDKANLMAGELMRMGIPVHYKKEGGFFDNAEIMTVISMLRVIDNPVSDVPLLSVLLSPLTAFCEDDVALLRTKYPRVSLYSALKLSAEAEDAKAKDFLSMLDYFRTLSVTLSVPDLIRRIYEVTSFDSVVSAMDGGDRRVLNLQKLTAYAEGYTAGVNRNLSGFLRYIDKLCKNGYDLEGAETVSEKDNVVRIMTYHKSKGLEFPVVILANMSSKFRDESKEKLPVNKGLGAGAMRYIPSEGRDIKTQHYSAVIRKNDDESTAENLRLLYVAMTRAKEKLILVGSAFNPQKKIEDLFFENNVSDESLPVAIKNMNSFFDWVLFSLVRHPAFTDFGFVKRLTGREEAVTESKFRVHFCEEPEFTSEEQEQIEYSPNSELTRQIADKITYTYPYDSLVGLQTKYTASAMDKEQNDEYFATEEPAFMGKGHLTPAKRGTLIHRFMELCDLPRAAKDVEAEITRLVSEGTLSEEEAAVIDRVKLQKFFESDMFTRIMSAETYFREKEFTMSVPLCDIHVGADIPKDEYAVVQGVMDGFILNGTVGEVVDFKTDRVTSPEELAERYKKQMAVYKRAAEECFGACCVNVTLYSFELSQEISVKFEKNT